MEVGPVDHPTPTHNVLIHTLLLMSVIAQDLRVEVGPVAHPTPYPVCVVTHTLLCTSVISQEVHLKQVQREGGRHLPAASASLLVASHAVHSHGDAHL